MKASRKATFNRRRMLAILGATMFGIVGLSGCASQTTASSAALTIDVYNPKETAIFPLFTRNLKQMVLTTKTQNLLVGILTQWPEPVL